MNNERYKSTIGFTDLLFNILVGFAFLFIIAFLLIKPEAKKDNFERKAEFVIIMEWDHDSADDIDLYVYDPNGGLVSYRRPRLNLMHLDKDDLGTTNDTIVVNGIPTIVRINREVVTIRGIVKGEYIINAHYFSNKGDGMNGPEPYPGVGIIPADGNGDEGKKKRGRSVTVKIEVHKVNPYSIVWVGEKEFYRRGQEETFVRFRLNIDGVVMLPVTYQKRNFITMPKVSGAPIVETNANGGVITTTAGPGMLGAQPPEHVVPERSHYEPLPSSAYNAEADTFGQQDGAEH